MGSAGASYFLLHFPELLYLLQLALDLVVVELAGCVDVELSLHDLPLDGGGQHGLHDEGE